MCYMGFGTQRWISIMKPRKFFGKRSNPDGGVAKTALQREISDYYHVEKTSLSGFKKENTLRNTNYDYLNKLVVKNENKLCIIF